MKILIYSPAFYPSVGGLETVVSILAHEFVKRGEDVKLVCKVKSKSRDDFPFEVIRNPNPFKLLALVRWCDVYFQPNISLKGIWPLFMVRKPWVIAHHGWYTRSNGRLGWQDRLKRFFIRFATCISVSRAVANHIPYSSTVIPNPYREDIFYEMSEISRNKDLVFLGRLVSDKGCNLIISALTKLKQQGLKPMLTIIGEGPEETNLRNQVNELKIENQVDFVGIKVGKELATLLNAHKILVVPSIWNEPFGIVALEGAACGCVVVGSEGGGLKDAIGPCGVTFPNASVEALTQCLADLLLNPSKLEKYRQAAKDHLLHHKPTTIAEAYLKVMEDAFKKNTR